MASFHDSGLQIILHRGPQIDKTTTDSVWLLLVKKIWQPWPEMSTDQDWIGLEPIFAGLGLDRTAFFSKLADQDWIELRKF